MRLYSVQGDWSLLEHRCESDESGNVWAVVEVERLGAFALVIDDSPATADADACTGGMATPTNSVIGSVSTATVRTSLPAQPPTPVPTAVPTAMPVPVAQAIACCPDGPYCDTDADCDCGATDGRAVRARNAGIAGDDGTGGIGRIILAAIGVPMLIGALIVILLMRRERQRRNGYHA